MADLKICRICLRTEAKVYKLNQFQLQAYYEEVTASKIQDGDNLPQNVCYECATSLHKFHKFKEKCYRGLKAFKEILWKGELTYESIYKLDRKECNLQSPIEIMTVTKRIKSYSIAEENTTSIVKNETQEVEIDYVGNPISEDPNVVTENNLDGTNVATENSEDITTPVTIILDVKKEGVVTEVLAPVKNERRKEMIERDVMNYSTITHRRTRFLDATNWKKYSLSEEEALKEFRARTQDKRYMNAAYKCTDCYKGFSKAEMLKRHRMLRHCESIGAYACRMCRMRFKCRSHARVHTRQHYTTYECLRCRFVCPLENTALLHDEYHSGITRKCIHCGEEFRHASTYYTHLRTSHRSEFVCTACGVSFVNRTGLHQHRKVKHALCDEQESPDEDAEVNSYCDRCDLWFETRKAYEEHLFHSVMHADGVEDQLKDEITIPKKVLSKRLRAKITKELKTKKSTSDDAVTASDTKRRKRLRRKRRKPTTCHQCGKHFETQQACMKHHTLEHPRTSFYPTTQRHICEICGASLAPGSVAVHQNMHSKQRVFACDTCGKHFHSTVGLKRHFVTHTGEKPFACSLCDKRFTQSNSMKLHYRTFHLKQPYPKRNRRKKPTDTQEPERQSSESDTSDGIPTPDMTSPVQLHPTEPMNDVALMSPGEPKQYLTLN